MSRCRPTRAHRLPGFSLAEILVVLVLMALAAGIVSNRIGSGADTAAKRQSVRGVMAIFRDARRLAILQGTAQTVSVQSRPAPALSLSGRVTEIPTPVVLTPGTIVFFPDGSSTGGRIRIGATTPVWITIEPFVGAARLEAGHG